MGDPQRYRRKARPLHPLGHMGEPDAIARGVVYLASDESKFMTGSELLIDGGYTCRRNSSPDKDTPMFEHILLPTDGSKLSLRAARLGSELAGTCGARVHVLHVVAPFHTIAYLAGMLAATEITYNQDATARAGKYLAEVQHMAAAAGIGCTGSYVFDDHPHEAIIAAARGQHCDLIVMASHGWRGITRLLLGSEVHKVLLESEVPVLVCR
jgi:nucleotide-binding universal stress UspA family protein